MRILKAGLAIAALATIPGFAQSVISAHSGVIHYTEGKVLVNGKAVDLKPSEFPELKPGSVLKTEEGRAELLLTPGVFLRVGENSSVRMVSNHLSDTRVEVLSGESLVECDELLKDNQVTMLYKDTTVAVTKHGLYRFDASPGRLRVYDGEAVITGPSGQLTAKKGHEVMLNGGPLMASKFDVKTGDELMRWAARRSGYISMANVASARSAGSSGSGNFYGSGFGYGSGLGYGSGFGLSPYSNWVFNPLFGMYTFIPMDGVLFSPFGNPFWSPYGAYMYAPYWSGYGGYPYAYAPGGSSASTFHPVSRGATSYSASGRIHSAPAGLTGGRGGSGNSGVSSGVGGMGGRSSGMSTGGISAGGGMSAGGGRGGMGAHR